MNRDPDRDGIGHESQQKQRWNLPNIFSLKFITRTFAFMIRSLSCQFTPPQPDVAPLFPIKIPFSPVIWAKNMFSLFQVLFSTKPHSLSCFTRKEGVPLRFVYNLFPRSIARGVPSLSRDWWKRLWDERELAQFWESAARSRESRKKSRISLIAVSFPPTHVFDVVGSLKRVVSHRNGSMLNLRIWSNYDILFQG